MYLEALKKIIKDLVNICGEKFDLTSDNKKVNKEISNIENKIEVFKSKEKLTSNDKADLEILELRKESWLNSASYLGYKLVEDFENEKDSNDLLRTFELLYSKAVKSKNELNESLFESNSDNILDAITKLNISYIKDKARIIEESDKSYSNIYKHYLDKKSLNENVIKTLNEKRMIVEEIISLYQKIIKKINDEVSKNNEDLMSFGEKKNLMAFNLLPENTYEQIDNEVSKLREIKVLNQTELQKITNELEEVLKEKETIENDLQIKKEEQKDIEKELQEYKLRTENKEYDSHEDEIDHNIDLLMQDVKLRKLKLQKDFLYVDIDKMRETALSIISNPIKNNSLTSELEGEYSMDEIRQIEDLMKKYEISKDEAIQTIELIRRKNREETLVKGYMEEFNLTEEEAEEAVKKESSNRFWTIEEE